MKFDHERVFLRPLAVVYEGFLDVTGIHCGFTVRWLRHQIIYNDDLGNGETFAGWHKGQVDRIDTVQNCDIRNLLYISPQHSIITSP